MLILSIFLNINLLFLYFDKKKKRIVRTCDFLKTLLLMFEFAFSHIQTKIDVLPRQAPLHVFFGVWNVKYFGDSTSLVWPVWHY